MVKRENAKMRKLCAKHFHAANKDDNLAARRKIMKAECKQNKLLPSQCVYVPLCVCVGKVNLTWQINKPAQR